MAVLPSMKAKENVRLLSEGLVLVISMLGCTPFQHLVWVSIYHGVHALDESIKTDKANFNDGGVKFWGA